MGKKNGATGYQYLMTMFMGLCRGPIDAIVRIEVGGKTLYPRALMAWIEPSTTRGYTDPVTGEFLMMDVQPVWGQGGTQPPINTSETVPIQAPDLFGGTETGGEGGMIGDLEVMMGDSNQQVNPTLVSLFGDTLIGAYRGIVTIVYDGVISAFNPYPKPWRFRVVRLLQGWGGSVFFPGAVEIQMNAGNGTAAPMDLSSPWEIRAMNPAHIIYECMTNQQWGRGIPEELVDTDSFVACANTLRDENFGLCLKWARQDTIEAFVQIVLDHIGAVLFTSRSTGEVTLRLIRGDYDNETIPVLSYETGLLRITEDETAMPDALVNEIIVDYIDPRDGNVRQTRVQNIALINSAGSVVSKSVSYPGIPTEALASRVAQRDLQVHSTPLRRMRLDVSRTAWAVTPGDVLRISDLPRGIESLTVRVLKTADRQNSVIELTVVQDVFGLPFSSYTGTVPDTYRTPPPPIPARHTALYEVAYAELAFAPEEVVERVDELDSFVVMRAARPLGLNSTGFLARVGPELGELEPEGAHFWQPCAVLAQPIGPGDTVIQIVDSDIPIASRWLHLAYIGDERVCVWLRLYPDAPPDQLILAARGVYDTVPMAHPAGTPIFIEIPRIDPIYTEFAFGQVVRGRALTRTPAGVLHVNNAPEVTRTLVSRHVRPDNVRRVKINNVEFYDVTHVNPNVYFDWGFGNRVTEAAMGFIDYLNFGHFVPEAGATVTFRIIDKTDDSVLRTVSGMVGGILATEGIFAGQIDWKIGYWTYTTEMWVEDGSPSYVEVQIWTVRDTWDSWQMYKIPLYISVAGWGANWGDSWGS